MKAVPENYMIQTVSRAMDLLEQFQQGEAELGITDLSTRMNLQKNNVFRLVSTLRAKKYIELNNSTGKYRLGSKTRALGQAAEQQLDYSQLVRPYLVDLKLQCHETCYFSMVRDGFSYYLEGVESDLPVRVTQRIGTSRPLHSTAAGQVQLAFMETRQRMDQLTAAETAGASELTKPEILLLQAELERVAQQGFAVDDQGHDAGVVEIAAPVFDSRGAIVGALSVLGPEMRLTRTKLDSDVLPLIRRSAAKLSCALGYCQDPVVAVPSGASSLKPQRKSKRATSTPFVFAGINAATEGYDPVRYC